MILIEIFKLPQTALYNAILSNTLQKAISNSLFEGDQYFFDKV